MRVSKTPWKLLCAGLALSLCIGGAVFAAEEQTPAEEPETVVANTQTKTLGKNETDAIQVKVINNTGKDLVFFAVNPYTTDPMAGNTVYRMQEALIQEGFLDDVADGSAGPKTQEAISAYREANGLSADGGADEEMLEKLLGAGYDGNLLEDGDVFAAGETRILYVSETEQKDDAEETTDTVQDVVAEALKEFSLEPEFVITFREKDQEREYVLYAFPVEELEIAQLNLEDDTAYVMYTTSNVSDSVSTLDAEKAVYAVLHAAPETPVASVQDSGYYDTGYDAGYDYGYDAGYVEPAPVSNEPYIVFEEYYPSCDDGSHGVHYIEYSDGSTAQIEY